MRQYLSCSVELRRFGVWRAALAAAVLCAIAAAAAWNFASGDSALLAARIAAAFGTLLLAAAAMALGRVEPGTLAKQAGRWRFALLRDGSSPQEGELTVAWDAGAFMLLILQSRSPSGRTLRRWLPAQRRGMETEWHALRCAVYAPQRRDELP